MRKANPLVEYAGGAPSRVMRFVAQAALAYGLTQESLAKELSRLTGRAYTGANVGRHFDSERPHEQTIAMYSSVLRLPEEAIAILAGRGLSDRQLDSWEQVVSSLLGHSRPYIPSEVIDKARRAIRTLDSAVKKRALEEAALATHTALFAEQSTEDGWPNEIAPSIKAIAPYLRSTLDLKRHVKVPSKDQRYLYSVWLRLRPPIGLLSKSEADSIILVITSILRARSVDVKEMLETYRDLRAEEVPQKTRRQTTKKGVNK